MSTPKASPTQGRGLEQREFVGVSNYNLARGFWQVSQQEPDRLCIWGEPALTYGQAAIQANAVASWLGPARRVAILASRSSAACVAVLGACWAGATYYPLSLRWPERRLAQLLSQIQPDALLVDDRGQASLTDGLRAAWKGRILHPDRAPAASRIPLAMVEPEATAYVIFTSGSSGTPKGVMIQASSLDRFLDRLTTCFDLTREDRLASNFELCFDGSVLDMFLTWRVGCSLYLVPPAQAMAPHAFLQKNQSSICLLTPSVLRFMACVRQLKPDSLPALRWALFGAESLTREDARLWNQVAPQARQFNLYGPTENTIASLLCEIEPDGEVSLGKPLDGLRARILDAQLQTVQPGQPGQLVLWGDQLALGYFAEPELTRQRFPICQGERCYLTGDRAFQDEQGDFHYLGRSDLQVKIQGHRVELEEIEECVRSLAGPCQVAALAWPNQPGELNQIIALVAGAKLTRGQLQLGLKSLLPAYSLPARIYQLESLPHTENGKLDRKALLAWLNNHG